MRYRNLITTTILGLALTCAYAVTAQAAAPAHCVVTIGDSCQKIKPPGEKQGKHNEPSRGPITADDIKIEYFYSGPGGIGQKQKLQDNKTLQTGDRITIKISAKRKMYLYLFHFDSAGDALELIQESKKEKSEEERHLAPNDILILPSKYEHFYLYDTTGTEKFYAIVSIQKLPHLMALYHQSILTSDILIPRRVERKLRIGRNTIQDAPKYDLTEGAYREVMVIQHQKR